jgi:ubiquinone/menaquinone biosynthesis C-methylase UbiE
MTHPQTQVFIDTLGNQWLANNREIIGKRDPVDDLISEVRLPLGGSVLEVGCSNGWRLKNLREKYGCDIYGIDPSEDAVKEANEPTIVGGTADRIPFSDLSFDTIIMGFCLYVVHPSEWFKVLVETDRALKVNGHLIIYDFTTPRSFKRALINERDDMFQYIMDWPKLWQINPLYQKIVEGHLFRKCEMVTILKKRESDSLIVVP